MVGRRSRSPSFTRTRRSPRRSPSYGTRRSRSPTNGRSPSYNSQRSSRSPSNSYSSTRRSPYTRRSRSRSRSPRLHSRNRNNRDQFDDSEFYNRNHPSFTTRSERQENSASTRNSNNNSTSSTRSDMTRDSHCHSDNYGTDPSSDVMNQFQNDGSFLAMFKKRAEEQKAEEEKQRLEAQEKKPEKKSLLYRKIPQKKPKPLVTGVKKEPKKQDVTNSAWEAYMREVEAYKTNSCADDDRFSRPLCK